MTKDERSAYAAILRDARKRTDSPRRFCNLLKGPEHNRSEAAGRRYIELHGGTMTLDVVNLKRYVVRFPCADVFIIYGPLPTVNPRVFVNGYSAWY
jgi:hypothetical protein